MASKTSESYLKGVIEPKVDTIATDTTTDIPATITTLTTQTSSNDSSGTFSYLDAGGEQDVVELTITKRTIVHGVWLDFDNITQPGTVGVYYKVDGSNYREVVFYEFNPATDEVGYYINLNMGITNNLKITYEESVDEGAARDIVYSIIYEIKEE